MRFPLLSTLIVLAAAPTTRADLSAQLPESLLPGIEVVMASAFVASEAMLDRAMIEREEEGRLLVHRSATLPQFGVNFAYNQEDELRGGTDSGFEERLVYSVNASQPLYHWGARQSEKKIGELNFEIEQLRTETTKEALKAGIRSRYMDLVLSRYAYQIAEDSLRIKREEFSTEKERSEKGLVSSDDLFAIELEIESLEIGRLRAESDYQDKLDELSVYSGMDREALEASLAAEIPALEPLAPEEIRVMEKAAQFSEDSNEELAEASRSIEVYKRRLEIEKVALRPKFDLEVGATQNARDFNGLRREEEYLYAGVSVKWNIFDGFRRKGRTIEAMSRLQRYEEAKRRIQSGLERDLSRALLTLEIASRSLNIMERRLANGQGNLEFAKQEFAEGRMSETQFDLEELGFRRESLDTQYSRANYLNAVSQVDALLGGK